jgi:hypothetical protein
MKNKESNIKIIDKDRTMRNPILRSLYFLGYYLCYNEMASLAKNYHGERNAGIMHYQEQHEPEKWITSRIISICILT